jgi:transcriptional regulator with XRE-family HTH domain
MSAFPEFEIARHVDSVIYWLQRHNMQYGSTDPERTLAATGLGGADCGEGEIMTDVVEIAKVRRADLVTEIAKIDDFIRLADVLEKYGESLTGAAVAEPEVSTGTPIDDSTGGMFEVDDEADSDDDVVGGNDELAANLDPVPAAETVEPATKIECDLTNAFAATAIARELASSPKTDRATIDPDHFAFEENAAPTKDELVLINPLSNAPGPVDLHIGQRLRQRRWMMGMSQRQLGQIIGVEFDQVHKFETGVARISVRQMWDIAAAMEVPVSYFFEELEGQAADTGEARSGILTDEEAMELLGAGQHARRA